MRALLVTGMAIVSSSAREILRDAVYVRLAG